MMTMFVFVNLIFRQLQEIFLNIDTNIQEMLARVHIQKKLIGHF